MASLSSKFPDLKIPSIWVTILLICESDIHTRNSNRNPPVEQYSQQDLENLFYRRVSNKREPFASRTVEY